MTLDGYEPGTAFSGILGWTTDEAVPAWPRPARAVPGSLITPACQAPLASTGIPYAVTVDLPGDLNTDAGSEIRLAMTRQQAIGMTHEIAGAWPAARPRALPA